MHYIQSQKSDYFIIYYFMIVSFLALSLLTLALSQASLLPTTASNNQSNLQALPTREFLSLISEYETSVVPVQKRMLDLAKQDFQEWKKRSLEKPDPAYDFDQAIWDCFQEQAVIIAYRTIITDTKSLLTYLEQLPQIKKSERSADYVVKLQKSSIQSFTNYDPNLIKRVIKQEEDQDVRWEEAAKKAALLLRDQLTFYQSLYQKTYSQFLSKREITKNQTKISKMSYEKLRQKNKNLQQKQVLSELKKQHENDLNALASRINQFAEEFRQINEIIYQRPITIQQYIQTSDWNYMKRIVFNQTLTSLLNMYIYNIQYYVNRSLILLNHSRSLLNSWQISTHNNFTYARYSAKEDGKNASTTFRAVISLNDYIIPITSNKANDTTQLLKNNEQEFKDLNSKMTAQELQIDKIRAQIFQRRQENLLEQQKQTWEQIYQTTRNQFSRNQANQDEILSKYLQQSLQRSENIQRKNNQMRLESSARIQKRMSS